MATIGKFMALESLVNVMMGDDPTIPDWDVIAKEAVKLGPGVACYSYGKSPPSLETWYRALKRREDLPLCWQLLAKYVKPFQAISFPQKRWENMVCDAAAVDCAALVTALLAKIQSPIDTHADWFERALQNAAQTDYNLFPETRAKILCVEDTAFYVLFNQTPSVLRSIYANNVLALRLILSSPKTKFLNNDFVRIMYFRAIEGGQITLLNELNTNAATKNRLPIQSAIYINFIDAKHNAIGLAWHIDKHATRQFLIELAKSGHLPETVEAWKNLAPALVRAFKRLECCNANFILGLCTKRNVYCRWPIVSEFLDNWTADDFTASLKEHPEWGNCMYAAALFSKNEAHLGIVRTAIVSTGSVIDTCLFTGTLDDFREMVVEFYGDNMPPLPVLKASLHPDAHCCFPAYLFDKLSDETVQNVYDQPECKYSLAALRYLQARNLRLRPENATYMWSCLLALQRQHVSQFSYETTANANNLIDAYHDAGLQMTGEALACFFEFVVEFGRQYHMQFLRDGLVAACMFAIADGVTPTQPTIETIFYNAAMGCIKLGFAVNHAFECMFDVMGWRLTNPWSILDIDNTNTQELVLFRILRIVRRFHPWHMKRNRTAAADYIGDDLGDE